MSKAKLYQKIVAVMNEVGQLAKDGTVKNANGGAMYNFLSEEQTTSELQSAFIKHGLVMFPIKVEDELIYIETVKQNNAIKAPITRVRVTYKIVDSETGEFEELQSIGYGSDSQDKGSNKAMTGAFKYVQRQTFMISTGDDGDHVASQVLDEKYKNQNGTSPNEHKGSYNRSNQTPSVNTNQPIETPQQTPTRSDKPSEAQVKFIHTLITRKKLDDAAYRELLMAMFNVMSSADLTGKQAKELITYLQK